jgi:hypothetical protein
MPSPKPVPPTAAPKPATSLKPATTGLPLISTEAPDAKPIPWAQGMVAALKKTGTGETTLKVIRQAMVDRFNDPAYAKLPDSHADRHLTSKEAIGVLERELPGHTITIDKARQLMETGRYIPPPELKPEADLIPLPPEGDVPDRELPEKKEQPLANLGVVDSIPGVHQINAETQVVGLKPIGKLKVGT